MTATNHALTGAIIGLTVANPWVAIPAAFLSHFICDIIPHFGVADEEVGKLWFRYYLAGEAFCCLAVVLVLYSMHPAGWVAASFAAFAATTPDFASIRQFWYAYQGRSSQYTRGVCMRFLARTQWFQRPIGAAVELVWFACALYILSTIL